MIAVKTEGLTKKYKDLTAVDGLNLEIQKGEIYALLGVNGAGKTTAVKMLSCLLQPTGGEAFLCGKSILKARSGTFRRNIFQINGLRRVCHAQTRFIEAFEDCHVEFIE